MLFGRFLPVLVAAEKQGLTDVLSTTLVTRVSSKVKVGTTHETAVLQPAHTSPGQSTQHSSWRFYSAAADNVGNISGTHRSATQDPVTVPSPLAHGHSHQKLQTPTGTPQAISKQQMFEELGLEDLLSTLMTPLPVGGTKNQALNNFMVQVGDHRFLDPSKALESVICSLYVLRLVLQQNGHVYIINSNPVLKPLMREAALCCINPNIWWYNDAWVPGALTNHQSKKALFKEEHQPCKLLLNEQGLTMQNPLCPETPVMDKPKPSLDMLDKFRLWSKGNRNSDVKAVFKQVFQQEIDSARLPIANSLSHGFSKLTYMVVLDLSWNIDAINEAYEKNVMTASVVNAHSELHKITYPIYASEFNPRFLHFYLSWLLKVANLPAPS